MRPIQLSMIVLLVSLSHASAQTLPSEMPTTYPESGTFCGFLTLCGPVEISSDAK